MQINYFEAFMLLSAGIALVTWLKTLLRIKAVNMKYVAFCISMIIVMTVLIPVANSVMAFLLITLLSIIYIGNNQRSHLTGHAENWPDFVAPVLLAASFYLDMFFETTLTMVMIYLAFRVLWIAYSTISILRQYWFWRNPEINPGAMAGESERDQSALFISSKNR